MKALKDMVSLLESEDLSYNDTGQAKFKTLSLKFLRKLAKDLGLKEHKVYFNPGGIAVSGDAHLMGMWTDDKGIYISINQDFHCHWRSKCSFLYRTIKHMKDYTGGSNNFISQEDLKDYNRVLDNILRLK